MINNSIDKNKAEKDILAIAEELGVKIMTDKELKEFTEKAEADYKRRIKMEIINHLKLNKEELHLLKKARVVAEQSVSDLGHQIGCIIKCQNGRNFWERLISVQGL